MAHGSPDAEVSFTKSLSNAVSSLRVAATAASRLEACEGAVACPTHIPFARTRNVRHRINEILKPSSCSQPAQFLRAGCAISMQCTNDFAYGASDFCRARRSASTTDFITPASAKKWPRPESIADAIQPAAVCLLELIEAALELAQARALATLLLRMAQ